MASKLRMHKVQRVSHLFDSDDIMGKSVNDMKMRIKAKFNCKNAQKDRGKSSNIFVKELIKAGIVSNRLAMNVIEYPPYEVSQRPPSEIELLDESGLCDKIAGAENWEDNTNRCREEVKLNLYTDGSLVNGTEGAYAWLCTDRKLNVLMHGGGKESLINEILDMRATGVIRTTKASSTRQEALAILAMHLGMREVNLEGQFVTINVSDSTAAIDAYRALPNMFPHEILKKNNSDIWRLIYAAGKKYGFIKMKHTKAHMDRTVKAEDLSEDSRGNIMADKLAEEMHNGENSISATEMASCLTSNLYYNNVPVKMAIRRWMPYMVQVENARRYWLTHMPEQVRSAICWETMHESVKDLKHITRRVNFMKILWGTFEYQQKKMEHRFIPASQN